MFTSSSYTVKVFEHGQSFQDEVMVPVRVENFNILNEALDAALDAVEGDDEWDWNAEVYNEEGELLAICYHEPENNYYLWNDLIERAYA